MKPRYQARSQTPLSLTHGEKSQTRYGEGGRMTRGRQGREEGMPSGGAPTVSHLSEAILDLITILVLQLTRFEAEELPGQSMEL